MKCTLLTRILAAVSLAMLAGCVVPLHNELPKQNVAVTSPDEFSRAQLQELPEEIEDLQVIPQNVSTFTAAITTPLNAELQAISLQRFREHYFSPWTAVKPQNSISQAVDGMKEVSKTTWYGENRLKVSPDRIKRLLKLAELDRIPSMYQAGIAIEPTFMRGLPTSKPLYETSDDFPFDQLQYTEVKPNEPLRILHASTNGAWLFVETAYGQGWVKTGTVMTAGESLQQRMTASQQVVIVMDFAVIRDEKGRALPLPRIGTLYPLVQEEPEYWLINVAVAGEDEQAMLKTARVAKRDARRFPLPFTADTVTHVGNELLKTPYGWGELFRDRDCSATTRDFFIPFGIWLPRNSRQQIESGPLVSLANLPKSDKENLIRQQGIPFQTLVHRKGHIMLYAGLFNGKPVVMHNTWAIRFKTKSGKEEKFYIGRTVLTTLEAGDELPLSRGTLLDHIDGILLLPSSNQAAIKK
jgi:cell wall-associated NlpC family hydrolase